MIRHLSLPPAGSRRSLFRRRDQKGAAMLEFALVVIPFVFVLYALVALGMALAVKQSVTNAAAEGARSAVGVPNPVVTATSTVANRLSWLGGKYVPASDLTVVYFNPTSNLCDSAYAPVANATGVSLCVTVNVPYKAREIVPPAPIANAIMPTQVMSTAIVQIS